MIWRSPWFSAKRLQKSLLHHCNKFFRKLIPQINHFHPHQYSTQLANLMKKGGSATWSQNAQESTPSSGCCVNNWRRMEHVSAFFNRLFNSATAARIASVFGISICFNRASHSKRAVLSAIVEGLPVFFFVPPNSQVPQFLEASN